MSARAGHASRAELYDPVAEVPVLYGNRCARCGTGFFPVLRFGCEVCGADDTHLLAEGFAGDGELWARARVADARGGDIVVAEIALAAGPKIRVLLADGDAQIGDAMVAIWTTVDGDPPTVAPRWVRAGAQ